MTNPLDVLKDLQDRVTRLEQQAGDQPGADNLQSNVITFDGNTIGADFTGHVHAQGVDLDAATTTTPPTDDQVRWLRQADGSVVATIGAYDSGPPQGEGFQLIHYSLAGEQADLYLSAQPAGNNPTAADIASLSAISHPGNGNLSAHVTAQANDDAGNSHTVTLIDAAGQSSFPQLQGARRQQLLGRPSRAQSTPGGWTPAGGSYQLVPLPTISYDPDGHLVMGAGNSYRYQCPTTGLYLAIGRVAFALNNSAEFTAELWVNGAQRSRGDDFAATTGYAARVADILQCNAGDQIELVAFLGALGSDAVAGFGSYLTVIQIA